MAAGVDVLCSDKTGTQTQNKLTLGEPFNIDAIRESREIFQRMNSYAIYRIAETLRVLLFMTPLGWGWAMFVWAYALVWFLVSDRVKLLAYRIFDPAESSLVISRSSYKSHN